MVLLEFQMTARAEGDSVSAQVAQIVDIIDRSGLPYQLTPMGTIIEGEWDQTFAVVTACFEHLRRAGNTRIAVNLKVDWREGPAGRLQAKTAKVEQLLGRKLRT
ncbi:MAG: MTH1187 family thiamine-binding protein [Burkholderiaceae bacterium]